MPAKKAILEYLGSDSPVFSNVHYPQEDVKPSNKGRNITSPSYAKPKCIMEWEDFEFDSLQAIYNGRLRMLVSYRTVPNSERAVFCQETRNLAGSGRVETFRLVE